VAERATWAVSNTPGEITTVDARHAVGSMMWGGTTVTGKRVGKIPHFSDPLKVSATSPTPDGFVHVSPGHLWSTGTRSIAAYVQTLDTVKDINILAVPAHASLTRWDLIVAQQSDKTHADANNAWWIGPIRGTPSATPSDPVVNTTNGAPTNSPDYVVLARVVVPATAASAGILTANITQLLTAFTVPIGAILPVADVTERDALIGTRHDGMVVWRKDCHWIECFDGTAFRVQGLAVCNSSADRATKITHPQEGTESYLKDTDMRYVYDGTVWVPDRTVAGRIASGTGFINTGIAGTEVNVAKVAIENYRATAGHFYMLSANIFWNFATVVAGDSYVVRVRRDTALSGTIIAEWVIRPVDNSAFDESESFNQPWKATADDADLDVYLSVIRVAGSGTLSINGDRRTAFWLTDLGGDTTLWSEVP
jgi:hypothetical protein